jgi:hypothetical protein
MKRMNRGAEQYAAGWRGGIVDFGWQPQMVLAGVVSDFCYRTVTAW